MIKVKIDGKIVHLPTLKGADGKSAYQYAVEAGYEGTEQEFINLLIQGTDLINAHLTDSNAHIDIRDLITALQNQVNGLPTILYVDSSINNHDKDNESHSDIRELINKVQSNIDNLEYATEADIDEFFI